MWGQESQPELWSIPVHLQNINDTPAAKDFWIIKEDKVSVIPGATFVCVCLQSKYQSDSGDDEAI